MKFGIKNYTINPDGTVDVNGTQKLDIDTNLYSGINGFEIVYDPKLLN